MRHPDSLRAAVLRAVAGVGLADPVARAYGLSSSTVRRWADAAGVQLPPAAVRMRTGREHAIARRWGDWRNRRDMAAALRDHGATLHEIARAVGYRSIAAAHYALRDRQPASAEPCRADPVA